MDAFRKAARESDEERALRALLEQQLRGTVSAQVEDQLLTALQGGDYGLVSDIIDGIEFIGDVRQITDTLTRLARLRGRAAVNSLFPPPVKYSPIPPDKVVLEMAFDAVDRRVVSFATQRGAELVVQISDELRNNLRREVMRATSGSLTPQQMARRIARVIPLHERFANAVLRRERTLLSQFLADGMAYDAAYAKMERLSARYAAKLTRLRARTIARTEIMTASNYGQWEGYNAAVNAGFITPPSSGYKAVTREWITAEDERVCEVCGPLDKVQVDWSEPFPNGRMFPPAHPNCRCSYNVIDNADQRDYDGAGTAEEEYAELLG